MTEPSLIATSDQRTASDSPSTGRAIGLLLILSIWTGLFVGLLEGAGLLVFQRINWENWGRMIHVSPEIIWISPLVDVIFFSILAVVIGLSGRFAKWHNTVRALVFSIAGFAVYDWLRVIARIHTIACVLLALGAGAVASRWAVQGTGALFAFSKKIVVPLAILALLIFAAVTGQKSLEERKAVARLPQAPPGAPNVVVVLVDTLRADHLSCYGYRQLATPNIDRNAEQGVLFENAFSTTSWTLPSHVSLLTGRYPFEHGIGRVPPMSLGNWGSPRLGSYPTLGEAMERKGYRTGAFSGNRTYFAADLGFKQGFIHFEDYFQSPSDMFIRTILGKELVHRLQFAHWKGAPRKLLLRLGLGFFLDRDDEGADDIGGATSLRKRAAVVNSEMFKWIEEDRQRPFFAFLNYFDVHTPYGVPLSDIKPKSADPDDPVRYDEGIAYTDEQVGSLMSELKRRGLDGNTLVVFTSDHGEGLGQHGLMTHSKALYSFLIHVPLVFWYPAKVPAGVRIPATVTNSSLPSTIAAFVGSREQTRFPSPSLVSLWSGSADPAKQPPVLSELAENKFSERLDHGVAKIVITSHDGPMKSLVDADWHLIVHKNLGDQLFNLKDDPGEQKNLVGTPDGLKVHSRMLLELQALISRRESITPVLPGNPRILRLGERMDINGDPGKVATPRRLYDSYRMEGKGGDVISIEVRSKRSGNELLDPVITVSTETGELLQSCRNPGDDHIPPPGQSDPTPNAFDDPCFNDDVEPLKNTDSRLEVMVPGDKDKPVSLLIQVSDWNGAEGNWSYTISSPPATTVAGGTH